jgi:putative oxidoreductase
MTMSMGMDGTIDRKRLIFPALGDLYDSIAPYSYAIIRFCAGAIVIPHGYMKLFAGMAAPVATNILTPLGFPAPLAWAYFLGLLEVFGGAALALGFLTRPLALMFTVQLAIVTYWHSSKGYFFSAPGGGWQFPLLLTIMYAAIFFRGAGRCSIDRMLGKEF